MVPLGAHSRVHWIPPAFGSSCGPPLAILGASVLQLTCVIIQGHSWLLTEFMRAHLDVKAAFSVLAKILDQTLKVR